MHLQMTLRQPVLSLYKHEWIVLIWKKAIFMIEAIYHLWVVDKKINYVLITIKNRFHPMTSLGFREEYVRTV